MGLPKTSSILDLEVPGSRTDRSGDFEPLAAIMAEQPKRAKVEIIESQTFSCFIEYLLDNF